MIVHPVWRTVPDTSSSAIQRFDVEFYGQAAHAAVAPELGRNALDSVLLLFNGLNAWREHLPETSRLHGIILNGGTRPNIVPDYAKCRIYLRSTDEIWIEKMKIRFRDMVQGAALLAVTEFRISGFNEPYKSRLPNAKMNNLFIAGAKKVGLNPVVTQRGGREPSNYGDFSQNRPGVHPYFAISDIEMPCHSKEFAVAANSALGFENTLKAAVALWPRNLKMQ